MNKRMIVLLTALMCATPVLQVAASVQSMFNDIELVVKDTLDGKTDAQRLHNVRNALRYANSNKRYLQDYIVSSHTTVSSEIVAAIVFAAYSGIASGVSAGFYILGDKIGASALGLVSIVFAGGALFLKKLPDIQIYLRKNKIEDVNALIVKLEALETELFNKVYPILDQRFEDQQA